MAAMRRTATTLVFQSDADPSGPAAAIRTTRFDDGLAGAIVTSDFDSFFRQVEPRLRRSLAGNMRPDQVADAVSEAMLYAWEHRDRVLAMSEPIGYLYRVAQSRSRSRKQGFLAWSDDGAVPDIEPGLPPALAKLPPNQATAIWLVKACGFSQIEAAEAMDVSPSTVSTHVERGMRRLRSELGVWS